MAQLNSPGVSVQVIDESFYTPAAPGTVPLIVVASAEEKQNAAGTGTAAGTQQVNAGQVYLLTSQKDLADTFGTPIFKTDANNNPIHAGEQNEYGLQAAYSYLGVSNRAYVVRADIDLSQLNALADAPTGNPDNGTFWFDTASTKFGIFEWNSAAATTTNGQTFTNKVPTVITDSAKVSGGAPLASIGKVGDYAIVATTNLYTLWYKKGKTSSPSGAWVEVGTTTWTASWPAVQGTATESEVDADLIAGDTVIINGTTVTGATTLAGLVADINAGSDGDPDADNNSAIIPGVTAAIVNGKIELYSTGVSIVISGTALDTLGITAGTYLAPALQISAHTSVPTYKITDHTGTAVAGNPTGSLWIKTTTPNLGAYWYVKRFNSSTNSWETKSAPLYASNKDALYGLDRTGGGFNLGLGAVYVKYNEDEGSPVQANFKVYARNGVGSTTITSFAIADNTFTNGQSYTFEVSETVNGSSSFTTPVEVSFVAASTASATIDSLLSALSGEVGDSNIVGTKLGTNQLVVSHQLGGDIKFVDGTGTPIAKLFTSGSDYASNFSDDPTGTADSYVGSLWASSVNGVAFIEASPTALTTDPVDGQLWYNSIVDEVDIMINDGTTWVGYKSASSPAYGTGANATDPAGPIVSASKPTEQSDGTPLANFDLWIDTSDLENYPRIYRYNKLLSKWVLIDSTDQTTEEGIIFADARSGTDGGDLLTNTAPSGTIVELLTSDFVDFDAPSPALYPKGMLLWNLRRSGFNVKRFVRDYIDLTATNVVVTPDEIMTNYYPHRWVTESANQVDGAGTFGRKAQRAVVVQALQALINSNQAIRDEESKLFNLIACPGYPEVIDEMISLNYDRGLTSFVVGDTPSRLTPDATSLAAWGSSLTEASTNYDEYLAMFYPWGYTSDNLGNNVVVPPSHIMLRTIALSDNVSYPWFAPAGTRRGGVTNATQVGYINSEGEFVSVALNTGQRDTLAEIKVNPITFISGSGLVNYGQLTRARNASALDRINVARLVVYLRRRFAQLAKPYVFEPNDKITRDELKGAAENLLLELVGQRALYDYIVVCDESNNTPARIDRNELYLDIAIEPVKAVEFIYIPLRLKNTGEIQSLSGQ